MENNNSTLEIESKKPNKLRTDLPILLNVPFCQLPSEIGHLVFHQYQLLSGKQILPPDYYFQEGKSHAYLESSLPYEQFPHQRNGLYEIHAGLPGKALSKLTRTKYRTYYLHENNLPATPLYSEKRKFSTNTNYLPVPVWTLINNNGFVPLNVHVTDDNRSQTVYLINVDKKSKQNLPSYMKDFFLKNRGYRVPLESDEYLVTGISPSHEMIPTLSLDPEQSDQVNVHILDDNRNWHKKKIKFGPDFIVKGLWWGPQNSIIAYLFKSLSTKSLVENETSSIESFLTIYNTQNNQLHHEVDLTKWINEDAEGNKFFENAVRYYQALFKMNEHDDTTPENTTIASLGNRSAPLVNSLNNLHVTNRFVEIKFSVEVGINQRITVHDFLSFPSYVLYDFDRKQLYTIAPSDQSTHLTKRKKNHKIKVKSYADLKKMIFYFVDNPAALWLINKAYTWIHNENRSIEEGREILCHIQKSNLIRNKWELLWAATVGKKYKNNYFNHVYEALVEMGAIKPSSNKKS